MNRINILFCITILFLPSLSHAQPISRLDGTTMSRDKLTTVISELTKKARVTGLAVIVFNNNKPVYEKAFGYANAEKRTPLTLSTEMYGASLSKAVFSVMVMNLVEEGILNLDTPLQHYLPKPIYQYKPSSERVWHEDYSSLENDTLYKKITARMCLDHTSGFPNWRWYEPDQKLRVKQKPGSRYLYSGEGLVYLQVVLEKMLNKPLEQLMQEKVFTPAGMKNSSYHWLERFENMFAYGHDTSEAVLQKDKDNSPRSASTLETTPEDYAKFMTAVFQSTLISKQSTAEMFRPQIRIRSRAQFGPLAMKDVDDNDAIELSYGLGWGLYKSPYGWAAFKEGHGEGFQHYSVVYPDKKSGVLLMANSDNAESIFRELLETTIMDKFMPYRWENYIPYNER